MKSASQESIWDSLYKKDENKWKLESNLPKILKNKNVLEIGVGNGKTLKSILLQKPKQVTAIDISSKALNIVNSKFPNVSNLTLSKSSVKNLPFKDSEFDSIICFFTLNNLLKKERKKAVSEIYRVLKIKGNVIFSDFAEGDYRQKGKIIENNTTTLSNGLILHTFCIKEMNYLFRSFNIKELKIISSNPIRNKPTLKRKRIFMIA